MSVGSYSFVQSCSMFITAQESSPSPCTASGIPFSLCKLETVIFFFLSAQGNCICLRSSWLITSEFLFCYCLLFIEKYFTELFMKMLSPSPGRKSGIIISLSGPINAETSSHLQQGGDWIGNPWYRWLKSYLETQVLFRRITPDPCAQLFFVWSWPCILHGTVPESQNFLPSWSFCSLLTAV